MKSSSTKETNRKEQKPSFWLLHLLGWLGYIVIFSFDNLLFTQKPDMDPIVIVALICSATIAAILTLPLRYIFQRCWQLPPKLLITVITVCCLSAALLWTPAKNTTMWYFVGSEKMHVEEKMEGENATQMKEKMHKELDFFAYLNGLSYSFFMIMVWSTLYFGINFHYRLIAQKQLHLEAVRLSHSAQIKMLRYQINPHFLFNTLNAISTLVSIESKEKAKGMLVRLSTFLRFSLDNDPEKKIPLREEIKACMLYLEIEKMRFDDRLSISFKIEQEAEDLFVPSLILQPLIENSIKYAIANMTEKGCIEIVAKIENKHLHLSVADNGPVLKKKPSISKEKDSGVGLTNIKERLKVLYPHKHNFICGINKPSGFKVDIWIPAQSA
ncbi:MAG: histidine kinase [Pseudomonadota bacterium]